MSVPTQQADPVTLCWYMVEHSIFRKESSSSQRIETAQAAGKSRDTVAGTSGYVAPPEELTYQEVPRREPQQCYGPGLLAWGSENSLLAAVTQLGLHCFLKKGQVIGPPVSSLALPILPF